MTFLGKNLFCSGWRPSMIFVIFGQTRNASFEIKTCELKKFMFYLNALKKQVHWETRGWNKWKRVFHCDRWRPFLILRSTKFRPPLERRRMLFFDKYFTCQRLVTDSWFWNLLLYDNISSLTFVSLFDLNLGHFHPLVPWGLLICCLPYF